MPLMIHSMGVGVYHIDAVININFRYHLMNFSPIGITKESLSVTLNCKHHAID